MCVGGGDGGDGCGDGGCGDDDEGDGGGIGDSVLATSDYKVKVSNS